MRPLPVAALCLCPLLTLSGVAQQTAPAPANPAPPAPATAPPAPAPEPPKSLDEALQALDQGRSASFREVPFEYVLEFHEAADKRTYASVTLGFHPEEIRKVAGGDIVPQMFVCLRGLAESAMRYDFVEPTDFAEGTPAGSSGMRVFQTGTALAPGPYRFSVGVWVPGRALAGGRSEQVVAPNFTSSAIELSSLTLAASVERAAGSESPFKRPFIWGNFKIIPRVLASFPRQEPLRLYYQIYNAAPDPTSGKPKLDITYTVYQKKNGKFLPAPPQTIRNQSNQVAIYELPVDAWPAGEFKVQVQVRDAVSNAIASRELLFELR
jgi:hypothetical protein